MGRRERGVSRISRRRVGSGTGFFFLYLGVYSIAGGNKSGQVLIMKPETHTILQMIFRPTWGMIITKKFGMKFEKQKFKWEFLTR